MLVETYEVEEATTGEQTPIEVELEAEHLIEELGLIGQQKLLVVGHEGTAHRVPYQRMTQTEAQVYGVLFPEEKSVFEYDVGPIPLRVLQVVAHGKAIFHEMTVWYPQTSDPDPVLVARLADEEWNAPPFLLARWGEALEPFETLYERAVARLSETWTANAERVAAECRAFLESPGGLVKKQMAGTNVYGPWTS